MKRNILSAAILGAFLAAGVAGSARGLDLNSGEWLYVKSDGVGDSEIWNSLNKVTDNNTVSSDDIISGTLVVSGLPNVDGSWTNGNGRNYGVVTIADIVPSKPYNLTITPEPNSGIIYTYNNEAGTTGSIDSLAGVYSGNIGGGTITYSGGDITMNVTATRTSSATSLRRMAAAGG